MRSWPYVEMGGSTGQLSGIWFDLWVGASGDGAKSASMSIFSGVAFVLIYLLAKKAASQLLAAVAKAMRANAPEMTESTASRGVEQLPVMAPTSRTSSSRRSGGCAAIRSLATSVPSRGSLPPSRNASPTVRTPPSFTRSRAGWTASLEPGGLRPLGPPSSGMAVDEALREVYARALGAGILNTEGNFPEQLEQTFTWDPFLRDGASGSRWNASRS